MPPAPPRRPSRWPARLGIAGATLVLLCGLFYAGATALNGASLTVAPVTTPWARDRVAVVRPSLPPTPTATPSVAPTLAPSLAPSSSASAVASASPTPSPTPTPVPTGPFAMDLYEKGDFVGELEDTWCIPAAMQTSINIMDEGADTSVQTQKRLFDLAVSIGGTSYGGAEPEGWAQGLTQLGYGRYDVEASTTLDEAVKTVARGIRLTNRPAGLMVWYGWHSWVVSGFTATADPALTDEFTVTALRIEDVWYNRRSSLWSQDRGGYSRPPDSLVPVNKLPDDFKAWHQGHYYPGKEGKFVFILPVASLLS